VYQFPPVRFEDLVANYWSASQQKQDYDEARLMKVLSLEKNHRSDCDLETVRSFGEFSV